ncbi:hypothetical protein FIBSPDRAFT_768508 [Athelia psychrophila]|uniref:Uncharacterized protein n=1 Tax=Athelia psychrophila TaxID=1759441 RepID=A0A167U9V6_9AGAM|nr:hypothetical protein FIBSPDRAFT_768508 [Fibularhizoctonia sp. CBS 109695]
MSILARHGYVLPPVEYIEDKSKGDWFSKGVALLQTFWFLAQCIARRAQHLSITQLEVVTLSYCVINLLIYGFWWHKPLNVDRPIDITIDITPFAPQDQAYLRRKRDQRVPIWQQTGLQFAITDTNTATRGPVLEKRGEIVKGFSASVIFFIVGMAFGALHFVAWSYPFSSHTQHVLWRVCCVALVVTPYIAPPFIQGLMMARSLGEKRLFFLGILTLLYVFARLATMVISFTTLGSLPPSATDTVQWTRYIPHF